MSVVAVGRGVRVYENIFISAKCIEEVADAEGSAQPDLGFRFFMGEATYASDKIEIEGDRKYDTFVRKYFRSTSVRCTRTRTTTVLP